MPRLIAKDLEEAIDFAKHGDECMVICPSHADVEPSLHVSPGDTQPVVMKCMANCDTREILDAAGYDNWDELMAERTPDPTAVDQGEWTPKGPATHIYNYVDADGRGVFQVLRIPRPGGRKTFMQRQPNPDGSGRWQWNLDGIEPLLYHLPEVIKAKADGHTIWVVEGEKDVEALRARGEAATTNPAGAKKWHDEFSEIMSNSAVNIIADKDDAGREHARVVKESLELHGCSVAVYEAAGLAKDVSDHFANGGSLLTLLETSPAELPKREHYGVDILEAITRTFSEKSFVIPGTLARGDRLLITGFEGHGKSTFLRQLAVQVAAGIHPFNGKHSDPKKVIYVDCENHPDQVLESWQDLSGLAARHGKPLQPGQLFILEEWDSDLDLTADSGYRWLMERIHAYKPDLICMGPLYNMSGKDLKDDETVRKIKRAVNDARGLYGTAFIMEHHAPHKNPNDKERSVRPYGSSTFLKWPDFGFGLRPMTEAEAGQEGVYEWQKTRFPRVRTREFPDFLRWGKENTDEWFWTPAYEHGEGDIH